MIRSIFLAIILFFCFFSCKNDANTTTLVKPKPDTAFIKKIAQQLIYNSDSVGLRFNYIEQWLVVYY